MPDKITPKTSKGQLVVHQDDGLSIQQRPSDGYVNGTAMAQAVGKRFYNYARRGRTKELCVELARTESIPVDSLIQSVQGGPPHLQGSWVHPSLAVNLAMWCHVKLEALATILTYNHGEGGSAAFLDMFKSCAIPPRKENPCYVYLIEVAPKMVKIGVSNDPLQRLEALQGLAGHKCRILETVKLPTRKAAYALEKHLHDSHSARRIQCEVFEDAVIDLSLIHI